MTQNRIDFKVLIDKEKIREYMQVPPEAKIRFLEELAWLKTRINKGKRE